MEKLKKYLTITIACLLVLFIILILNQVVSIYNNLLGINKYLAIFVTGFVIFLLVFIVLLQVYSLVKYPRTQRISDNPSPEELWEYKIAYLERLKKNKVLKAKNFEFKGETIDEDIARANAVLEEVAMERIKEDANSVFLTTAISQNGTLDGISVMFTLGVMIYRIIEVYENRPSLRRLIFIYGQVASVILVAYSIEDLDLIEEQIEPLVASLLGSTVISALPGGVNIASIIINSIMEGSINALLTLRVGIVTKRYLSATEDLERYQLKKGALIEATGHLGSIIAENGVKVVKAISRAVKKSTVDKFRNPFVDSQSRQ